MNRYFNSAGTSFLVGGLAPGMSALTQFGQAALKSGGFGKFSAVPTGYGRPNAGLAPCDTPGGVSSFTSCVGAGTAGGSLAAGIGIAGQTTGGCVISATIKGLAWGIGSAAGDADAAGTIMGVGVLSGLSDGASGVLANIFAAVAITGASYGTSGVTGEGYLAISLVGESNGQADVYGSAAALINTSGLAEGISTASGETTGAYFAIGMMSGASTAVCTEGPTGYGWIAGHGAGSSTGTLTAMALGLMSGSTDIATGQLTADQVAVAVWSYER